MAKRESANRLWDTLITRDPPKNGEVLSFNSSKGFFCFEKRLKLLDILNNDMTVNGLWTFMKLITANGGIHFPDNIKATFGNTVASPDAELYSDGTDPQFIWNTGTKPVGLSYHVHSILPGGTDFFLPVIKFEGKRANDDEYDQVGCFNCILYLQDLDAGTKNPAIFLAHPNYPSTANYGLFQYDYASNKLEIKTSTATDILIKAGLFNAMFIDAINGYIGCYTPTPASEFDVNGTISIEGANTQIWKDAGGDMKLKSSVAGEVFLADLVGGGMEYKYIKALAQSAGNLNLSDGTNWNVDKALIKTIRVVTASTDWSLTLYPDDDFDELGTFPSMQIASGFKGSRMIQLNHPYSDEDATKEVHLKLEGTGTFDVYIFATGME